MEDLAWFGSIIVSIGFYHRAAPNLGLIWETPEIDDLLEVLLSDVGAGPELADEPDPDIALEAHDDGGVHGGHHGDLDQGKQVRQDHGINGAFVEVPGNIMNDEDKVSKMTQLWSN